jgi:hypothetical protein
MEVLMGFWAFCQTSIRGKRPCFFEGKGSVFDGGSVKRPNFFGGSGSFMARDHKLLTAVD